MLQLAVVELNLHILCTVVWFKLLQNNALYFIAKRIKQLEIKFKLNKVQEFEQMCSVTYQHVSTLTLSQRGTPTPR